MSPSRNSRGIGRLLCANNREKPSLEEAATRTHEEYRILLADVLKYFLFVSLEVSIVAQSCVASFFFLISMAECPKRNEFRCLDLLFKPHAKRDSNG